MLNDVHRHLSRLMDALGGYIGDGGKDDRAEILAILHLVTEMQQRVVAMSLKRLAIAGIPRAK
jgi:hypothetical protein